MPNLTAEFMLNDAKPPVKGRTFYWDDKLKGFGLMVTASGHKTFVVQCRVRGQSRRMHLRGVSTARDARDLAQSILSLRAVRFAKSSIPFASGRKRTTRALQHYLGHRNIQHTVRYSELSATRFNNFWK